MSDKPQLLVVEDDDIVRMLTVDVLAELGYRTLEAEDAEQALKILESETVALLVTDQGLPGMSGLELAAKAREKRPGLPVLIATGYGESIEVPADMHLIGKPFSIDKLRDKVKGILG